MPTGQRHNLRHQRYAPGASCIHPAAVSKRLAFALYLPSLKAGISREKLMKTLFLVVAVASLSGCVMYPANRHAQPQVVAQPVYPKAYNPPATVVVPVYPAQSSTRPPRANHGSHDRDRDGDGISNRRDHDRDGDGTRNREDRRPNDSRTR